MSKVGHLFLADLGKKRLRPGGVKATNFLLNQGNFRQETQVLEVACNMGTNLVELAKKYDAHFTGVDIDKEALGKATDNIQKHQLTKQVDLLYGNALKLPFEDDTFDIVLNEAMLTMLDDKSKLKALKEYYRVLKPGGKLLTHDICLLEENAPLVQQLSKVIKMKVAPLPENNWQELFETADFHQLQINQGKMSLMNPIGMIQDEGLSDTFKIIKNGLNKENRQQFKEMFRFFKKEQDKLYYIAIAATK